MLAATWAIVETGWSAGRWNGRISRHQTVSATKKPVQTDGAGTSSPTLKPSFVNNFAQA